MKERLQKICAEALEQIKTEDDLEQIRIRYLGKKGELTAVLRGMGQLSAEERPVVGQLANEVRARIENALQEKAEALMAQLRAITELPVIAQDERLTTVAAHQYLSAGNVKSKKRKAVVDALSAQIILQNYLDKQRNLHAAEKNQDVQTEPEER